MITLEELCGIVEVMTVVSDEEMLDIVQELAYIRDEEVPDQEGLSDLIESALKIHWLESISQRAVFNSPGGSGFYIAGPACFGTVPLELSEIMGMMGIEGCRFFDWETVSYDIRTNLSRKLEQLKALVESAANGAVILEKAESEYSELFNLYYDSDFWLPDGLPDIGASLENISQRLTELKKKD